MAWAALMAVPPSISIAFCFSMPHCKHDLHMNQTICEFCLPSLHYHKLMTYGERLQKAMDERGVDRKTLAKAIDVTPHAIGMAITGGGREERWLSRENNGKAAKYLKVDAHWLFTGEGQMLAPIGAANGSMGFTGQATGEHYPPSRADGAPVAGDQLSNHAKVIGQMYDDLPDDKRLRAKVYAKITNLLGEAMDGKVDELLPEPVAVASRKRQLS